MSALRKARVGATGGGGVLDSRARLALVPMKSATPGPEPRALNPGIQP